MPTLVLDGEYLSVNAESQRLNIVRSIVNEDGKRDQKRMQVPLHDLDRVIVVGRPSMTVPVLQRLMFARIPCYFTTANHRWIGSLMPDGNKDAARRLQQYKTAEDNEISLRISKAVVNAKIRNSRRVLQRLASNRIESMQPEQQRICGELKTLASRVLRCINLNELRGLEGLAAALYFKRLGAFFPESVPFETRSRRPPKDAANALLSWTYTIVLGEIECEIRSRGLDPCIGFLHEVSHGTPSLALDLLEPLRAPVCDLLTLNLLNHKILTDESFEYRSEEGGVFLRQESHRDFFQGYERTMMRKFSPVKGAPHTDLRRVIADMVSAVLRAMNGDKDFNFFRMP